MIQAYLRAFECRHGRPGCGLCAWRKAWLWQREPVALRSRAGRDRRRTLNGSAGSASTAVPRSAQTRAPLAIVATHLAASAGAFTWMALEWWTRGKPSVLGMISGAVAGLGTITPASGF